MTRRRLEMVPVLGAALAGLAATLAPAAAEAAPVFVDRGITLPKYVFAADLGLGLGRRPVGPRPYENGVVGAGLNLEAGIGITDTIDIGFRTGIRLGDDGRFTGADAYGRTLWTETYNTLGGVVANPELRLRWALYSGRVTEVGLDFRATMPVEDHSRFGTSFGVPLAFHLGQVARIDTGVYLPLAFYDRTLLHIAVPGYFWFQVSDRVWLGPMTSLRHRLAPDGPSRTSFLLGFGLGVQVASAVDLKTMIFFPDLASDEGARAWGAGFGVQLRAE